MMVEVTINKKYIPQRTCLICKKKGNKQEYFRLVLNNSEYIVDTYQKMDGRGIYICKNIRCVENLGNKKVITKLFHGKDTEKIIKELKGILNE